MSNNPTFHLALTAPELTALHSLIMSQNARTVAGREMGWSRNHVLQMAHAAAKIRVAHRIMIDRAAELQAGSRA